MFCGRVGVVGVVGAALVLLGVTQVVAGCYYMLALPIFQLGSNIWTGSWSIVCGAAVATIAWTNRTMRRGHVILVATISVLVANVANLVILQVGENEDLKLIVESNLDDAMKIAFWLTTVVTALSIVVSFFGAQYLFCVVVRGPRLKGGIPVTRSLSEQDLHHRQVVPARLQSCNTLMSTYSSSSVPPRLYTQSRTLRSSRGDGRSCSNAYVHDLPGDGNTTSRGGDSSSSLRDMRSSSSCNSSSRLNVTVDIENNNSKSNGKKKLQIPDSHESARILNSSGNRSPKTPEDSVPYFLRKHPSSWPFILPEVVEELTVMQRESCVDSVVSDITEVHSRTSTLSRCSKSSFHPFGVENQSQDLSNRPDILSNEQKTPSHLPDGEPTRQPSPYRQMFQNRQFKAPSSCASSLYSIPESCHSRRPSPSTLQRPSVPPPPPPTSSNLREHSADGWESCAIVKYPPQAGGGFVIDLD